MMNLAEARILVTGGNGFLGRHAVAELRRSGAREVSAPRSQQYDLREREAIRACINDAHADVIIHLAAVVGGIGANRAHPGRFFYENAIMGIELIEQARRAGVQKVVVVGTVCAYPKLTHLPFHERDLWDGYPEETNAPYGLAKKMLLVQAQAYRQEYGFNVVYVIPTNLYGPGDNFDPETSHVIPALIRKFVEAKEQGQRRVVAWGTGGASREFLYVEDAARAIALATRLYDGPDPINLGSGREVTIRHLAEVIARLCEYGGDIEWDASLPDGQPRRVLDTSRAQQLFGFKSRTELEDGLRATIDWYLGGRSASDKAAAASNNG